MLPLVSIIIPHWNGIDVIAECLKSIQNSTYPNYEIIVVDNDSSDDSVKHIKTNFPDVRLLENSKNEGYAGGCNRGAEIAKGKYLLFLNNDTIQDKKWIEPLVDRLEKDDNIASVQPKILNYYDKKLFDYAGGAGGKMDVLGFPFARGRIFNEREIDEKQYDSAEEIFWSSGTAFLVRKSAIEKVGKFDEMFFAHMEEIDLCWRFYLAGYSVYAEPKSIIYHKNAVSLPMYSEEKYYLNHRNSLIMLFANYTVPLSVYLIPFRWALDVIAMLYAFLYGDWKHIKAINRAHFWIATHPIKIYDKRKMLKPIRKVKDRDVMEKMYKGSIVFSHYIMRKNCYSELFEERSRS